MRFMVMLQGDTAADAGALCEPLWRNEIAGWEQAMRAAGVLLSAEALEACSRGIQVSMDDDSSPPRVTRGPLHARRVVARYWLIQVASRAEAIDWARQVPGAAGTDAASIEVRELHDESFCSAAPPAPSATLAHPARRYVAFLKADAATEAGLSPSERLVREMFGLLGEIAAEGCLVSGDGLKPSAHGARVEQRGGKVRVIDGPFAETKELVAGLLVVRAPSEATVVAWACRMLEIHLRGTHRKGGEVEIRPSRG